MKLIFIILLLLLAGFLMVSSIELGDPEDECEEGQYIQVKSGTWECSTLNDTPMGNLTFEGNITLNGNFNVTPTFDICIQSGNCLSTAGGGGFTNGSDILVGFINSTNGMQIGSPTGATGTFIVNAGGDNGVAQFKSTDSTGYIYVTDDDNDASFGLYGDYLALSNYKGFGAQHLLIDSSGHVGIHAAPGAWLTIAGTSTLQAINAYGAGGNVQTFRTAQAAPTASTNGRVFTIDQTGKVWSTIVYYSNSYLGAGSGDATRDAFFGRQKERTFRIGGNYDGTGNGNLIINENLSVGTTSLTYPMTVIGNNASPNNITIYTDGNVLSTGYLTSTSVWKDEYGSVWDYVNPFEDIKGEGKIDHTKLSPNVLSGIVPIENGTKTVFYWADDQDIILGYKNMTLEDGTIQEVPIHPQKLYNRTDKNFEYKEIELIYTDDLDAKHEQALYELKQAIDARDLCVEESSTFEDLRLCWAGVPKLGK